MPFANVMERDLHFSKHGHKFGATSAIEYEKMADDFMFGALKLSMKECVRPNAVDRLRCNITNQHFGAARILPPYLKTFYPVPAHTSRHHGGFLSFFAHECGRMEA
jgi:hypothetical protein